jgi:hypothetical protein
MCSTTERSSKETHSVQPTYKRDLKMKQKPQLKEKRGKIKLTRRLSRSQWPRGLRRRSAAERLLGSWVRIAPGAWMFVSCTVFVLSGRGLCGGPIPRPEESYRLWCVFVCDQVEIQTPYTYCEQVGRNGKDYETKQGD